MFPQSGNELPGKRKGLKMTIMTIYGSKGMGKTALTTYLAYETYKAKEKDMIVANYKLNFPFEKLNLANLQQYQNALVVFDEAHIYVDNRKSMSPINRLVSYFVYEIRHLNTDLITISQQESIDIRLKNATDVYLLPEAWVYEYETDTLRRKRYDDEPIDVIFVREIDISHQRRGYYYLALKDLDYNIFTLYDDTEIIPFMKNQNIEHFR